MRLDVDGDVQVARRTPIGSMFAFMSETQSHAGFNASRNVHSQRPFTVHTLAAPAGSAGVGDDLAGSLAVVAGSTHAEEPLLESELARSLATRADLQRGGGTCPCSPTVLTAFPQIGRASCRERV